MVKPSHPSKRIESPWARAHRARHRLSAECRRSGRKTPRDFGLAVEDFSLETSDGFRLTAWFVPGTAAPNTTLAGHPIADYGVVVHHHYGGGRATALPWTVLLARLGLDVLSFDARGHGRSTELGTDKDSFVQRGLDVVAACDELKRRGKKYLIGCGQSQGAAVILNGMATRDDLAGMIFDSGPSPEMVTASWGLAGYLLGQSYQNIFQRSIARSVLAAMLAWESDSFQYAVHLWRNFQHVRQCPLLWLHGDADQIIPRRLPLLWYSTLRPRGGRWRSFVVQGAGHVMCLQAGGPVAENAVSTFVKEVVGTNLPKTAA